MQGAYGQHGHATAHSHLNPGHLPDKQPGHSLHSAWTLLSWACLLGTRWADSPRPNSRSTICSHTCSRAHPLTQSFLTHSSVHSLIHSFIHSFIYSPIDSFIDSLTPFTFLLIHPLIHLFIHPLTHSFVHSLTYSLIHSFTRSVIILTN